MNPINMYSSITNRVVGGFLVFRYISFDLIPSFKVFRTKELFQFVCECWLFCSRKQVINNDCKVTIEKSDHILS